VTIQKRLNSSRKWPELAEVIRVQPMNFPQLPFLHTTTLPTSYPQPDTNDHTPSQRLPDECFSYTISKTANAYSQSCRQIQYHGRPKSPLRMYQRSAIIPSETNSAAVFSAMSKASMQSISKRNLGRPLQNRWRKRCNRLWPAAYA
jgi:hypothetical protein